MGSEDIERVNDAIRKDTMFLASCNIMDYSLLLGIESKVNVETEFHSRSFANANRKASVRTTTEQARFARHRF